MPENAYESIETSPSGSTIDVRDSAFAKAQAPMLFSVRGNFTCFNWNKIPNIVKLPNASLPMWVIPSDTTTERI